VVVEPAAHISVMVVEAMAELVAVAVELPTMFQDTPQWVTASVVDRH
jgi:L-asparagine transporter-like permease